MQIEISHESALNMAQRLNQNVQAALGCTTASALQHSQSLEILANTLGYENWDTLSGMLKANEAGDNVAFAAPPTEWTPAKKQYAESIGRREKPPVIATPFNFYWEALACSEWGEGPKWATIFVTQAFVNMLHDWQTQCLTRGSKLSFNEAPDAWDSDDEYRIVDETLNVSNTSFWFSARPKQADYNVETRMLAIKDFFDAIDNPEHRMSHLAWADGMLFMADSCAKNLAQQLLDEDVIDINESRIEKMPS